jgi:hypothetical protein
LKHSDEEKRGGKEWMKDNGGKDGGKSVRNKKGGITIHHHLFVPPPAIMNL